MIRVTASLVHKSGAEILRHDSGPVTRDGLRAVLGEAITFLCDEGELLQNLGDGSGLGG
jgi:hypothetical protein